VSSVHSGACDADPRRHREAPDARLFASASDLRHAWSAFHIAKVGFLDRILRHITNRGDAWIARRVDIANHWLAQFP